MQDLMEIYEASIFAQLAYVDFSKPSMFSQSGKIQDVAKDDFLKSGLTEKQFEWFRDNYIVVDHKPNTDSGFSGTIFQQIIPGTLEPIGPLHLAVRGTEFPDDFIDDVLLADAPLALYVGKATEQYEDMLRFLDQNDLITVNVTYEDGTPSDTVELVSIDAPEKIKVSGHSLGGHLTTLLAINATDLVEHAYTFNGAGFGENIGAAFYQVLEIITGGYSPDLGDFPITNIIAEPGLELTAGVGIQEGETVEVFIEQQGSYLSIDNHSMEALVDSLQAMAILSTLDGSLTFEQLNKILYQASHYDIEDRVQGSDDNGKTDSGNPVKSSNLVFSLDAIAVHLGNFLSDSSVTTLNGLADLISFWSDGNAPEGEFTVIPMEEALALLPFSSLQSMPKHHQTAYLYAMSQWASFVVLTPESVALNGIYDNHNYSLDFIEHADSGFDSLTAMWNDRVSYHQAVMQRNAEDNDHPSAVNETAIYYHDKQVGSEVFTGQLNLHGGAEALHQNNVVNVVFAKYDGDAITGGTQGDRLYGNAGQDTLIGGAGADDLYGGEGNDFLISSTAETAEDGAADDLYGGTGNDVYALAGGDTASDTTGEDIYIVTSESANGEKIVIDDKDGKGKIWLNGKLLTYAVHSSDNKWLFDTNTLALQETESGTNLIITDHYGNEIEIKNFQNGELGIRLGLELPELLPNEPLPTDNTIIGDPESSDVIYDTDANDLIQTGGGDDTVNRTRGGNDTIELGDGTDILQAAFSNVSHEEKVTAHGGTGNDYVEGAKGNDVLEGGADSDILHGYLGNDLIYGDEKGERDFLIEAGEVQIDSGERGDFVDAVDGDDQVFTGAGNDVVAGGDGDDLIVTGGGADIIYGDKNLHTPGVDSYDLIQSWNASIVPDEDPENNSVTYRFESNYIITEDDTGVGVDTIYAGSGDDYVEGQRGKDNIFLGTGDDVAFGGANEDLILGGEGNDSIYGDDGVSSVLVDQQGTDHLYGESGEDTILGGGGNDFIYGGDDDDSLYGDASDLSEEHHGSDHISGGRGDDVIGGQGGNDFLYGDEGSDFVFGQEGNDQITGGTGTDYLEGGEGLDTYFFNIGDAPLIEGVTDNVVDTAGEGNEIVFGPGITEENLNLSVVGNHLMVNYHPGDIFQITDGMKGAISTFKFESSGKSYSFEQFFGTFYSQPQFNLGTSGDDYLVGGAAQNNLFGGQGGDTLVGGTGNSNLYGESGNDTLISQGGTDVLQGGDDDDHYIVHLTDHADVKIYEDVGANTLELISEQPNQPLFFNSVGDDLVIKAGEGQVFIHNWLSTNLVSYQLPDGSVLSHDDVLSRLNTAPVTEYSDPVATAEDDLFVYDLTGGMFSDPEMDELSFTVTQAYGEPLPAWLEYDEVNKRLIGTPENDDVGSLSLSITATDPGGFSTSNTLDITVENTNDAPVAVDDFVGTETSAEVIKTFLSSDSPAFEPMKISGGYLEFYPDLSSSGSGYNSLWARVFDDQYNELRVLEVHDKYSDFSVFKNDSGDIGVLAFEKQGYPELITQVKTVLFNSTYTGIEENILFNDPDSTLGAKTDDWSYTKTGFSYIGGDKGNEKFIFTNRNELETSVLLGGGSGEIQSLSEKLSFIADFSGGFVTHKYSYSPDWEGADEAFIHGDSGEILFSVTSEPGDNFIYFDRKSNGNYIAIEQSLEHIQGNGNYTNWQYDLVEYDASGNLVKELTLFPMGQVQEIHAVKLFDNDEIHLIYDKGRLDYYVNEQSYLYESVVSSDLSSVSEVVVYDSKKWSSLGEIISWTDDQIDFTINYFGYWGEGTDSSDYGHYRISSDLTNQHIPDLAISPLDNDFDVDSDNYSYYSLPFVSAQVVSGYGSVSIETLDKVQTHGNPDRRLIYSTNGYYDYLPEGQTETVQIQYTIQDDAGAFATATIEVQVNGVYVIDDGDLDPVIELDTPNLYATEDSGFEFIPQVSDEDPEGLTFELSSSDQTPLPAWIVFDPDTGIISGQPVNGDVAVLNLKLKVTDSGGHSDTKNLILEVQNTNDAPVAVPDVVVPGSSTTELNFSVAIQGAGGETWIEKHGDGTLVFWNNGGWKYQKLAADGSIASEVKTLDIAGADLIRVYSEDDEVKILSRRLAESGEPFEGDFNLYEQSVSESLEISEQTFVSQNETRGWTYADTAEVVWSQGNRKGVLWETNSNTNEYTYTVSNTNTLEQKTAGIWSDYGNVDDSVIKISDDEVALIVGNSQSLSIQLFNQSVNPESSGSFSNNRYQVNYADRGLGYRDSYVFRLSDNELMAVIEFGKNPHFDDSWSKSELYYSVINTSSKTYSSIKRMSTFTSKQNVIDVDYIGESGAENSVFVTFGEENNNAQFEVKGRFISSSGKQIGEDLLLSTQPVNTYQVFIDDHFDTRFWDTDSYADAGEYTYNTIVRDGEILSVWSTPAGVHVSSVTLNAEASDGFTYDPLENDFDVDSDNAEETLSLVSAEIISGFGSVNIVDGKVVYEADGAYDHLPLENQYDVVIEYTIQDLSGEESTSTITAQINGKTDQNSFADNVVFKPFKDTYNGPIITTAGDDYVYVDTTNTANTPPLNGNTSFSLNTGKGNDVIVFEDSHLLQSPFGVQWILKGEGDDKKFVLLNQQSTNFFIDSPFGRNILDWRIPNDPGLGTSPGYYPRLGLGSLKLTFDGIDTEIHLENFDPNDVLGGPRDIDTFIINGQTFSYEELVALGFDLEGDAGDNVITGTSVVDRFYGGLGDDLLEGGAGDDVYYYNLGDGEDLIIDQAGNNKIIFGEGISTADLNFSMNENDLVIAIGDSGQISVQNWDLELDHTITEFETAEGSLSASDVLELLPPPQNNGIIATEDAEFTYTLPSDLFSDLGAQSDLYLAATSVDGDALPEWLSFDHLTWTFAGTPENDDVGELTIQVNAYFGVGTTGSASHHFTLLVNNSNDAPETNGVLEDVYINVDADFSYTLPEGLFVDVDADDQLTISVSSNDGTPMPDWLTFNPETLTLQGTPTLNDIEELVVSVTATDLAGEKVVIPLQLTVDDYDNKDELLADYPSISTRQGTPGDDLLNGSNSDNLLIGGSGDDELVGKSGNDHLIGGRGNDFLNGGHGSDSYYFSPGFGHDMIKNYDSRSSSVDRIVFDSAITPDDVEVIRDSSHLLLRVGPDEVKVLYHFKDQMTAPQLLDEVHFADGTVWSAYDIGQMVLVASDEADYLSGYMADEVIDGLAGDDALRGNDGNDRLIGGLGNDDIRAGNGNDMLIGGEGNDYLKGDSGDDRYLFEAGHGSDTIHNESNSSDDVDTVMFADTLSEDLWFSIRWDRDLVINKSGTTDQVIIDDWYVDDKYHVDVIEASDATLEANQIDGLVQAMANFAVPDEAGEVITQDVKDQLQPVLATSWTPNA